jgi:hypothetical protein
MAKIVPTGDEGLIIILVIYSDILEVFSNEPETLL